MSSKGGKSVLILLISVIIITVISGGIILASDKTGEQPVPPEEPANSQGATITVISSTRSTSDAARSASISKAESTTGQYYYVKSGDSLYTIAWKFGITVSELMEANQLTSSLIFVGQRLFIPSTDSQPFSYTVRPGDTLYLISRRFDTTVKRLQEVNGLEGSMIYSGQKLLIPGYDDDGDDTGYLIYRVRPGDTLYLIALRHETTVSRIRELNGLQSDLIYVGQELRIPSSSRLPAYGTIRGRVEFYRYSAENQVSRESAEILESELPEVVIPTRVNDPSLKYQTSEVIVKYRPQISRQDSRKLEARFELQSLDEIQAAGGRVVQYSLREGEDLEEVLDYYNSLPQVEWAEPNYIYQPTAVPDDSYYQRYQWNLRNLNLEAAWNLEKGSQEVIVAVLDTGVILEHPDLRDNLLPGADFVGGMKGYSPEDYDFTDDDPTDETPSDEWGSHGTHVAGIIGAVTDNSRGVAGINWNVSILPVRVLKKGGGTSWDLVEGVYYAIDQGANIINMSLGGNGYSRFMEEALEQAVQSGVTVIAASGNENSTVYYPAALPGAIAVGAVNMDNERAYYSNYGPEIDVVAPGGEYNSSVFSTWGYYENGETVSQYVGMSGTSMAAPHVSGVAALLYASGIREPEEIRRRLTETARDLGESGRDDYFGYGLVDAYAALQGAVKDKDPARLQVFAVDKDSFDNGLPQDDRNNLQLKSKIKTAAADGSFTLEEVEAGEVYPAAWIDLNQNSLIDRGDYYGKTGSPVLVSRGSSQEVQIYIRYLSEPPAGGYLYLEE